MTRPYPAYPTGPDPTGPDPTGPEPTDADLLAAHAAGDPDAFGLLVARHQDRLWAVALGTLRHPEDAADALQDAYVSAFRHAGSFRAEAAVSSWLHRIVVNACLDRIRRGRVRSTEPWPEDPDRELGRRVAAAVADPADRLIADERRAAVLDALHRIDPDQRVALVLVDLERFSVQEAADILGCPVGTVKSRCARGRARLLPLLRHLSRTDATVPSAPTRPLPPPGSPTPPGARTAGAAGPTTRRGLR